MSKELTQRASKIKLFVSDVDGVWTNGTVLVNADGSESVSFSILDGFGLVSLMQNGVEVAVISGRNNPAVGARASKLGIEEVHLGFMNKGDIIQQIINDRGLSRDEVASIGDDLPDLEMFMHSGLCFAPPNAVDAVKKSADYVCKDTAGLGAVREVCDLILSAKAII
ncbi:MAG: HAD hydrolase family protein [Planctomycetes bacterium]|nr:HAD hydrolase family protein [Planctomycetota bacterium]